LQGSVANVRGSKKLVTLSYGFEETVVVVTISPGIAGTEASM